MRYFYSFLLYLAVPFILLRLLWRSRQQPDYRVRLAERFGFYTQKVDRSIWVHTVSVGEIIAAIPLIKALQQQYPALPIIVTTMTPTGSARVKSEFGNSVTHVYLPYDLSGAVDRFLRAFRPIIAIILETEMWPNLLAACEKQNIPVCLMNARLSEKSARGYRLIAPLTRQMLQQMTMIAAQAAADAARFIHLGAAKERVSVTGNIKFDLTLPNNLAEQSAVLREQLGKEKFIWIAASTHSGEEEIILAAHKKIRVQHPESLLILVPRHIDRFDAVAKLCEREFLLKRRSLAQVCDDQTSVYLADTMGELPLMYAVSDVAFVGGSLIPHGGHNILEPAALAKPIITGPHLFNFADINHLFVDADAFIKVNDNVSLAAAIILLIKNIDARNELGLRALEVIDANRGALQKQLHLINQVLSHHRAA
ncbi:MAG: hypothetical protein ACD_46C00676G0004 [uncultured bacterium]|nr:MAG: hypothetical protein ACD_46C00676G0004 [uncultured bacterium]